MESKFDPGTAVSAPTSTIEISISCKGLLDKDIFSKSDPMCVIYHRQPWTDKWVELLRTETINDNLNPDFATKLTLEYHFEEQQPLRFEVYDVDNVNPKLEHHDFLGFTETNVANIVSSGTEGLSLALSLPIKDQVPSSPSEKTKKYGTIVLFAEELFPLKDEVTFKLGGNEMGAKRCFFRPSLYYVISKVNEASNYVLVHRSDRVYGPNPNWKEVTIASRTLCNGDKERGLKIEFYEVKRVTGIHKLLGSCLTNLNQLASLGSGGGLRLTKPDGTDTLDGTFLVLCCEVVPIHSFVDYIQTGTKIHCSYAIDFTSSNGHPDDVTSLHHFSESNQPNPYEQAIHSVGEIIQDYDSSNLFPVYGFGARIPPDGIVSHKFSVSLKDTPYCAGLSGVLETYRNGIRMVQMYGPTIFSPIINHIAEIAAQNKNGEHYYILLIITDGIITDMQETKQAIVNAAVLPLSIVIVGVGGADFEAMEVLDGNEIRISHNGRLAERDIVHFVPYRNAEHWLRLQSTVVDLGSGLGPNNNSTPLKSLHKLYPRAFLNQQTEATHRMAQVKLAQEVLAEIPDQITGYMKSQNIHPKMRISSQQNPKGSFA